MVCKVGSNNFVQIVKMLFLLLSIYLIVSYEYIFYSKRYLSVKNDGERCAPHATYTRPGRSRK